MLWCMRLLVLGGTSFVGRAVVEDALARGWSVTTLNRGHGVDVPGVDARRGDRRDADGLSSLVDGEWDVVLDTWSSAPAAVERAATALSDRVGRYVFVSSRSVYAWAPPTGADESAPLVEVGPGEMGDEADPPYPQAKRAAEVAVEEALGDRSLLVRAGLILGPWENVGRLPWWLQRIARGGPVVAPGPPDLPLQLIDARDLARWTLDAAAAGRSGPHDLVSPSGHATMGQLLAACVVATGSDVELRWVEPDVVLAAEVAPWTELPIWLPPGEAHDAMHRSDVSRALATGLVCRPVEETVADTWTWLESLDSPPEQRTDRPPVGLPEDKEAALLA